MGDALLSAARLSNKPPKGLVRLSPLLLCFVAAAVVAQKLPFPCCVALLCLLCYCYLLALPPPAPLAEIRASRPAGGAARARAIEARAFCWLAACMYVCVCAGVHCGLSCANPCKSANTRLDPPPARERGGGMHRLHIPFSGIPTLTRPYHRTSTASHPNCEVKPGRDWLVRSWGTRLEAQLSCYFLFAPVPCCPGPPHRTAPHRTAPHRTAPHRTAPPRQLPCRTEGAAGRRSQWLQHGKHGK